MSQNTCTRCNRVSHFASDCKTLNNNLLKYKQPSNSAQYANDSNQGKLEDESGFEFVFSSLQPSQALLSTNSDFEDAWLLDTGANQHITFRKYLFWSFNECKLFSVFLVDDIVHTPQGKGCVKVYLPGIGEKFLSNIWYVPTLKKKLLSLVTI